jgi:hypothetical protein
VKRRLLFSIALLLLVAAWGTGCGEGPTAIVSRDKPVTVQAQSAETRVVREALDEGTDTPTLTVTPQREEATMIPTSTPAATGVEPPAGAEQVVQLAQEDLAQRLSLASKAIRLVSVEAVEWSDTSLGCPQPGMMYAQVITLGFRVVLEAKGKKHTYHTDRGRFVVLCGKNGLPIYPLIPVDPDEIQDGKPWMSNYR